MGVPRGGGSWGVGLGGGVWVESGGALGRESGGSDSSLVNPTPSQPDPG